MGSENSRRFPLEATSAESDFGFGVNESPSGVRALVVPLGDGLRAVKVRADDGSIEYAICDERLQPIYIAAKTLDELDERFRREGGFTD